MPFWKRTPDWVNTPEQRESWEREKRQHKEEMKEIRDRKKAAQIGDSKAKEDYNQWSFNKQVEIDSESEEIKEKIARLKAERERFIP